MSGPGKDNKVLGEMLCVRTIQHQQQRPLTTNEHVWVEFIRLASQDNDPAPTLENVQALRRIFDG